MQKSVDDMEKTKQRIILERQRGNLPEQSIATLKQKTTEFEESLSAMVRLLNFYRNLAIADKVHDMEIYLQSFGSYLWKASQVQIFLEEFFYSINLKHSQIL